jgi:RNA polymerase sigma factor (sigma-70 family)
MAGEAANETLRQIRILYGLGAAGGLTDAQLVERFLGGGGTDREDAFAALVERHGPMVLRVCRRMLSGSVDAEDAFQAVFLVLARKAGTVRRVDGLRSWLYSVAVRTAKEARRRSARRRAREGGAMDESRAVSAPDEGTVDLIAMLDEEINLLPSRYRDPLILCELQGASRHEAARQLGLPEGTLSSRLYRGRSCLRDRLSRRGVSFGAGTLAALISEPARAALPEPLAETTVRLALKFASGGAAAGGVPEAVASLAEGVIGMILVAKLKLVLAATVILGAAACLTAGLARAVGPEPTPPRSLTVGVVQMVLEPDLAGNRDKMLRSLRQAKDRGCRVVVFPETALSWPSKTPKREVDAAVAELRHEVDALDLYALIGGLYRRDDGDRPFERLLVIDPDGRIVQEYNKLWYDDRFNDAPGLFEIDGIPCAAALCADRWIRSVEDLPAVAGAKILFECSNNYANEWIPDLGWYWYVPRALRNETYVVFANTVRENPGPDGLHGKEGHGHSAVIGPEGRMLVAAGGEPDRLITADLDLARATGGQAAARRSHPLFRQFWETGIAILNGQHVPAPPHQPLVSPPVELKIAAAQMACANRLEENVSRIVGMIRAAGAEGADVVAFPELAVTGARDADIAAATQTELERAVAAMRQAARDARIHVACGLPWQENGKRYNCAVVIGPDGNLLTRYAQLVVDRPGLFAQGMSARAMWFEIRGVPCVVTIGHDDLWSEVAEMAALRGAQLHLHLAYDRDTSAEGRLLRKQFWANLASFRTVTATVNAASCQELEHPSAPAVGGSAIWEDLHRGRRREEGGFAPHSAVRLAEAEQAETILYASQAVLATNPQFRILTDKTNPQMTPWYTLGARAIDAELPAPGDTEGGLYERGRFKGRVAWSADGNHNDPDDWASSPIALAILAESGLKDRLVHFDYNCILPVSDAEWEKTHAQSVLGAAERYGYDRSLFFDCRRDLDAAVSGLVGAINASSADDPLYLITAGPMEVPCMAIEKSDPARRRFVYCISHSEWNDGFNKKPIYNRRTKRDVIATGVNWVQIASQDRLSTSPYGRPARPEEWRPWHWMRDSGDPNVAFLWERLSISARPDCSDAGMAYFLATGDELADPAKLRRLLDGKVAATPVRARERVRIEAENFRDLDGYQAEYRKDKTASHLVDVKLAGDPWGRILTRFDEPYAAPRGRYDVDVRYFDESGNRCRYALSINGVAQGAAWVSPAKGQGWTTQTLADVEIRAGDEISVDVAGHPGRLDFVQLNLRRPAPKPDAPSRPGLPTGSTLDNPRVLPGQVIVAGPDPGHPKDNGGGIVFLSGPDNPEEFPHRAPSIQTGPAPAGDRPR